MKIFSLMANCMAYSVGMTINRLAVKTESLESLQDPVIAILGSVLLVNLRFINSTAEIKK